jgi:hypothetical protein
MSTTPPPNYPVGIVASSTSTTIQDNYVNWDANMWTGYNLVIVEGTAKGEARVITSNTNQTITVDNSFMPTPDIGDVYWIFPPSPLNPAISPAYPYTKGAGYAAYVPPNPWSMTGYAASAGTAATKTVPAGLTYYMTAAQFGNTNTTNATTVSIEANGTVVWTGVVPVGGSLPIPFPTPLVFAAGTVITLVNIAGGTLEANAQGWGG